MYRKNVAGQNLAFCLVNASTGAALAGATVAAKRSIDGGAQASATGSVTDLTNGQYNLALSQADTNGNQIGIFLTATGAVPVHFSLVTTAADPTDTVRFGLTALPNVASGSAGALPTTGTGSNQLSVSSGLVTLAGVTHTGAVIPTVTTTTTATNLTTNNDKTGYGLSAAAVQAIWDALTGALTTASSVGKLLVDNINATISSRLASAGYTAPLDAATTKAQVVAALNTDTYAESAAVPAATATLVAKIGWLATLARNKITQTATTQLVRNDADSGTVATSTVSDDGTTGVRGKFS